MFISNKLPDNVDIAGLETSHGAPQVSVNKPWLPQGEDRILLISVSLVFQVWYLGGAQ